MRSRVAEAENTALSAERTAENTQTQEIAKVEAAIAEARAEAKRRIIDAETKGHAMVAEEKSKVVAAVAKATAELDVQRARIDQVRLMLTADKVKPAEAAKQEAILNARGQASKIIEEGKATAEAIRQISHTWAQSGDSAREIFVAQKLSPLIGHLMSTVSQVPVDKITFIDSALTGGNDLAVKAAVTSEQLKHTLGLDLPRLLRRVSAPASG